MFDAAGNVDEDGSEDNETEQSEGEHGGERRSRDGPKRALGRASVRHADRDTAADGRDEEQAEDGDAPRFREDDQREGGVPKHRLKERRERESDPRRGEVEHGRDEEPEAETGENHVFGGPCCRRSN